jgi:hypothetical protein
MIVVGRELCLLPIINDQSFFKIVTYIVQLAIL